MWIFQRCRISPLWRVLKQEWMKNKALSLSSQTQGMDSAAMSNPTPQEKPSTAGCKIAIRSKTKSPLPQLLRLSLCWAYTFTFISWLHSADTGRASDKQFHTTQGWAWPEIKHSLPHRWLWIPIGRRPVASGQFFLDIRDSRSSVVTVLCFLKTRWSNGQHAAPDSGRSETQTGSAMSNNPRSITRLWNDFGSIRFPRREGEITARLKIHFRTLHTTYSVTRCTKAWTPESLGCSLLHCFSSEKRF